MDAQRGVGRSRYNIHTLLVEQLVEYVLGHCPKPFLQRCYAFFLIIVAQSLDEVILLSERWGTCQIEIWKMGLWLLTYEVEVTFPCVLH